MLKSIGVCTQLMPIYSDGSKNLLHDRVSRSPHWNLPMDATSPWIGDVVLSLILCYGRPIAGAARSTRKLVGDTIVVRTMNERNCRSTSPR